MGYVWALTSVLLVSCAQLMMKWAMMSLPLVTQPDALMAAILTLSPGAVALLAGLIAYTCSMGCWFLALRRMALSKAYPLLSLSYVLVWAAAICIPWLNERFSMGKMTGVAVIFIGLLMVCIPVRKR
ncbi:4-amino-4-deoxy-L-arabinose-phosphoundecaprenol flippase subunit ArnF [Cronobacter turicensis]|jgi:undecaprenyl phosphate-alpha-L-ara4N flippase subunit ArnF|uniref:Probable 4-amino-4-deoxy-L-arabinose-phosphoundecaprenol flippase subunit ArnF n=1 Tax=Leclercia adecarboxylata TaxID=83655 RepID=A0ABU6I8P4_9ENTR|nr:4-amino-4-deoxy-L-arabinose-phosphoundecaprenol flippase subunit ArnF [Leclercia adecarboxylata]MBZ3803175.1 4-amino-4-deoxy-L-arabinose-phospho-UDP flippase [Leclercia adecarboxylata]MBZ3807912.1 4-amino-4-deoxy-L-arabinose-phospho-UDP flippase [Leclercia adecarboxylata]MDU2019071.1 4-amino-4-deoxy-L-arabinose-phosphoundecaprenol flippase subunit ArnF [Leclercia adecarboxylata]MEC3904416.1 4-amino-4-deoxy-L-arabinose-phosphoundecaprenol flippase subunit ArnF [Leclercia adecarboxylata]MEC39